MRPLPAERAFGATLAIGFAVLFVLLYGSASVLSAWVPWRLHVALPGEAALPFWPGSALIYLSMDLLLLACVWRLRWEELWVLWLALSLELLVGFACFLLMPVETDFAPRVVVGMWAPFFHLADAMNLERNFFPSLHVAFAITAGLALGARAAGVVRWGMGAWVVLIAASTVLMHEHHLADVAGGVALALAGLRVAQRWGRRPDVVEAVRTEWLLWWNQYQFAQRHLRYAWISVLINLHRLVHPRRGRLLVCGYCFLQALDDTLDGDRPSSQEPLETADALTAAWQTGQFAGHDDMMLLGKAFYRQLHAHMPAEASGWVLQLISVMRRDRVRRLHRQTWSEKTLQAHHHATFALSLDLLLAALQSNTRAHQVPELVQALGWCSAMRDLQQDMAQGIINIPAEILPLQHDAVPAATLYPWLLADTAIQQWMNAGQQQALQLLQALDGTHADGRLDPAGARIVRLFSRSLRDFALRRYPALHPFPASHRAITTGGHCPS